MVASTLVSVVKSTTTIADHDAEIVRRLHPILSRVEPYGDTISLCRDLGRVEVLQPCSSSIIATEARQEDILRRLGIIYANARNQQAEKVQLMGDNVEIEYRIAAIEIRHALLHCELDTIDAESGMMIYPEAVADVQCPGQLTPVIIRREDQEFWDRCIEISENNHPVCGVGNPGIGKTTTTIYLLQRPINQNKSVVYTVRRSNDIDIFYEFVPDLDDKQKVKDIAVKVYKMSHEQVYQLPILREETSVYVVDPGDFDGSCDASVDLRGAKFIMNASNDESHWGGSNFEKLREGVMLEHWMVALPQRSKLKTLVNCFMGVNGPQHVVAKKYLNLDHVGGSIRDIVQFREQLFESKVNASLLGIDDLTVQGLVEGAYQFPYKPSAPSNVLVGLRPLDPGLEHVEVILKSDYVEEQLAKRHLKISWYAFPHEDNAGNRRNLFESYLRERFSWLQYVFPRIKSVRAYEPSRLIQSQRKFRTICRLPAG